MKIDSSLNVWLAQKTSSSIDPLHASDQKLREQTDAFEAILLKTLLDVSLKLESPLYPRGEGAEIYESMYKDSLAENLSGGFGYSQLLFDFLKEQQNQKR